MYASLRDFTTRVLIALPLPLMLTLHDGDFGEAQVFLTTAPPGAIEYQCQEINLTEDRDGHKIRVGFKGLLARGGFCRMQKDPAPIVSRMAALTHPGVYTIEFSKPYPARTPREAGQAPPPDSYRLELTEGSISFEPEGTPNITKAANAGKYLRVPEDWLVVDFSFMDPDSRKKLSPKRDEFLAKVAKLGGKSFEPAAGTYLFGQSPRTLPEKNPRKGEHDWMNESYFYHFTGDWTALDKEVNRYGNYTHAAPGKPYMALWAHTRARVASSYGR